SQELQALHVRLLKKDLRQKPNLRLRPALSRCAIQSNAMDLLILSTRSAQKFLPMHADPVSVCGTASVPTSVRKTRSFIHSTETSSPGMTAIPIPMHLLARLN